MCSDENESGIPSNTLPQPSKHFKAQISVFKLTWNKMIVTQG